MPASPGEPAPIAGQGYKLVFEDDFDTLNRDVWSPPPAHGTEWPAGHVVAASSILTITADLSAPREYEEVWSLGPQQPSYPRYPNAYTWEEGYFEVRARVTNDPWSKLALWFFGLEDKNSYGGTRNCHWLNAEWDMVENGIRNSLGTSGYADVNHVTVAHRNTNAPCGIPNVAVTTNVPGTGLCDWHVWSGKWTGTHLFTYLDGVLQTTLATPDTFAQPMVFIMSGAPTPSTPFGNPTPPAEIITEIDWFRVWQRPRDAKQCMLSLPGASGDYVSTPDHASLRVTGDIDIRCEFSVDDITPTVVNSLVNRAVTANWSYQLALRSNGVVRLAWSVDGTATLAVDSAVLPVTSGQRIAVRVTMDVDNGSAQRVITFYTAPGRHGPWTQLGTPTTTAGTTSIFAGTRALEIGARNAGLQEMLAGAIYWAEVRDGIDGQVVARADFTDKTPGIPSFKDENGKVYTVFGGAKIMPGNPKPDLYTPASPMRLA